MNNGLPTPTPAVNDRRDSTASDTTPNLLDRPGAQEDAEAGPEASPEVGIDPVVKKRDDFLLDLLMSLDLLVYVELGAIYYLDTSSPLLLLRAVLFFSQLTIPHLASPNLPPNLLPRKPPGTPPNSLLLLLANIVCFFIHVFTPAPTASELTRFYLHGGLLIDFIGQKAIGGWTARFRLCAMDAVVAVLQLTACAVAVEKSRGGTIGTAGTARGGLESAEERLDLVNAAADQGLLASVAIRWSAAQESASADAGIEMQSLMSTGRRTGSSDGSQSSRVPPTTGESLDSAEAETTGENSRLLESEVDAANTEDEVAPEDGSSSQLRTMETFHSGQASLGDFMLADMIHSQFWEQRNRRLRGTV